MQTTYEIRSMRGNAVMAFDDETRARTERNQRSRRINAPLRLFRVTRVEEEI